MYAVKTSNILIGGDTRLNKKVVYLVGHHHCTLSHQVLHSDPTNTVVDELLPFCVCVLMYLVSSSSLSNLDCFACTLAPRIISEVTSELITVNGSLHAKTIL